MRYGQRGGYTPAEQQRRERLRLEAARRLLARAGLALVVARIGRIRVQDRRGP